MHYYFIVWLEFQLISSLHTVYQICISLADQVYGDQEMHQGIRQQCMDYMMKNRDYFSQYVTEDFTAYVNRKRSDHCHGNHLEIQAMSEMFNRAIQVYHYSTGRKLPYCH